MKNIRKQKGISLLSWICILAILLFSFMTAFKLFPHYYDFWAISKSIESLKNDQAIEVTSVEDFYSYMQKTFTLNGVRGIRAEDAMEAELDGNVLTVHLKYEQREPFINNLYFLMAFDKEFRVQIP